MFNYEADLVNTFISHIDSNILDLDIINYCSEFNYNNGKTDLIAICINNRLIAFEAKLKNIKKVINQAYRNTAFANYSYVVLPADKYEIQKKYEADFIDMKIGVILVDNENSWIELEAIDNKPVLPWLHEKATTTLLE